MRTRIWLALCAAGLVARPALAANEVGQKLFADHCVVCHQEDARGAAGVAPPLADTLSTYLASADGKRYLAQILVSGMIGPIDTQGHQFSGLMPSFRAELSDSEMAAVINYVLGTFNGASDADAAKPIAPQDVTAAGAANPAPTATRALRQSVKSHP
jgi:mono/diheme cytochrome c family protein